VIDDRLDGVERVPSLNIGGHAFRFLQLFKGFLFFIFHKYFVRESTFCFHTFCGLMQIGFLDSFSFCLVTYTCMM
jgi:hypothetical protein